MKTKKRRIECDEKSRETGSVNEPEQKKSHFLITTSSFEKARRNDKNILTNLHIEWCECPEYY